MIGVVGADAEAAAATVRDAGAEAQVVTPETLRDGAPDAVVALGEAALVAVAAEAPPCPVLAVDVDRGVLSVTRDDLPAAASQLADGDAPTRDRALLDVTVADRHHRALFDAMLVTAEPAQISEYEIDATPAGEQTALDAVRADGVVVATPVGSRGYARDAGGPTVLPGTDAVVATPVAPFTVDPHRWVAPPPITLRVLREEGTVRLRIDGRERGTVAPEEPVRIARDGALSMVAVPECASDVAAMEKT